MSCLKRKSPAHRVVARAAVPPPCPMPARGKDGHSWALSAGNCQSGVKLRVKAERPRSGPARGPAASPQVFQFARLAGHPGRAQHQGGTAEQEAEREGPAVADGVQPTDQEGPQAAEAVAHALHEAGKRRRTSGGAGAQIDQGQRQREGGWADAQQAGPQQRGLHRRQQQAGEGDHEREEADQPQRERAGVPPASTTMRGSQVNIE
ncbi:hypothetical protein G6F65_018804 [Rhizopus arrhizus]|nr:hypothetical protein G6F65_018804 [Rhizopus arrhizus]